MSYTNFRKAPELINIKPETKDFYLLDADIMEMAGSELGYPAFKLLMVLMGTKNGFKVSEEWVCRKAATTTKNYSTRDRKSLVEHGYILYTPNCGTITIDYANIQKKLFSYKLTQGESISELEFPQGECSILQVEVKIPQREYKFLQGEGYNRETEKINNITDVVFPTENVNVENFASEQVKKFVERVPVIKGENTIISINKLRKDYTDEWIAAALSERTESQWQINGFGLLFGKTQGSINFRNSISSKLGKAATPSYYEYASTPKQSSTSSFVVDAKQRFKEKQEEIRISRLASEDYVPSANHKRIPTMDSDVAAFLDAL